MATIARLVINWSGFVGAPGYTNMHFAANAGPDITQEVVDNAVTKLDAWINIWNSRLPSSVTVNQSPSVELIDDATGQLTGFMNSTPFMRGPGSGTGNYSAASGACVNWYTGGIRNGRRVRGRTFMVPLAGSALAPDGTIDDATVTNVRTANAALIDPNGGAAQFVVWGRPTAPGASDGISYDVISATLNDKVAVLRSRRD